MNFIDLTEEDSNNTVLREEDFARPLPTSLYKKEFEKEDEKPKANAPVISQYEWVSIDAANPEIDYIKKFQENHKDHKLDYEKLNIESLNPSYVEPNSYKGNIVEKIMKSLAKDGVLKEAKKAQDDYDMNDSFVDDTDHFNSNQACFNLLTPAFDDFICLSGDIDQFKRSNYFDRRLKIAKKNQSDMKKQASAAKISNKTAKKGTKDMLKKRPSDSENRPADEMKKVKKTTSPPEAPKQLLSNFINQTMINN